MENKRNLIGFIIIAIVMIGTVWNVLSAKPEAKPMLATNMTEAQRGDNDNAILLDELETYGVNDVAIGYKYDSIKVYLDAKSSDQYVSDKALDIEDAIPEILIRNRAKLTLEKDADQYHIYIYGKDGHLIN